MEPSTEISPAAESNRPAMSLGGRLTNIFATPGEVFEEVRDRPPDHANWWVPVLLLCLAGTISVWVIFSQPAILQNIREAKDKAMEQQLSNVPPAQRQMVKAWADIFSSPILLKVAGTFGAAVGAFAQLFVMAFVLWAIGQIFFKADFSYVKAMEVTGLAAMIPMLGKILAMLLILITGNTAARLSPAMFLSKIDPANPTYLMLNAVNVITLWYLGLLALGLAKLSRRPVLVPALCLYGLWAVLHMATITMSLMMQHLRT